MASEASRKIWDFWLLLSARMALRAIQGCGQNFIFILSVQKSIRCIRCTLLRPWLRPPGPPSKNLGGTRGTSGTRWDGPAPEASRSSPEAPRSCPDRLFHLRHFLSYSKTTLLIITSRVCWFEWYTFCPKILNFRPARLRFKNQRGYTGLVDPPASMLAVF